MLYGSNCNLALLVVSTIIGKINDCKKGNTMCPECALVYDMLMSISLKRLYYRGVMFSSLNELLLKKATLKWSNYCPLILINMKISLFQMS